MAQKNKPLTPLQKETLDLYAKKIQLQETLDKAIAAKEGEIENSRKQTIEKLNGVSASVTASQKATMAVFSSGVNRINAAFVQLDEVLDSYLEEGGNEDA